VATSSSAWAFELGLLGSDIRGRLSAALGPEAPTGLRFAPGRLPEPPSPAARPERVRRPRPSAADRREAERLAAPIDDENLRKVVAKAAAESLARTADRPGRLLD
jgi:hypothetical protein